MTLDEKKAQLALYRIQLLKIERLHQMLFKNPDRRDTYKSAIHRAERLRNSIEDAVERVDGGILSEILFQKYLCGKSLAEIAEQLCYSKRQLERLHIKALEQIDL